jgi:Spy/CpxP family protein refolding chaperone
MKTTSIALAAVLALTAGASFAQQPGPPPGPRGEHMRPDPAQMAERRAQHLRDTLQLRPEQEPALRAFIDAARPSGDRMGRRGGREDFSALSTPERLDRARARMVERMAAFDRRAAATKRFYAQLSPSQQKAFDAIGPRGGPGGRGDHHGGGGFRHGPDGPHD